MKVEHIDKTLMEKYAKEIEETASTQFGTIPIGSRRHKPATQRYRMIRFDTDLT